MALASWPDPMPPSPDAPAPPPASLCPHGCLCWSASVAGLERGLELRLTRSVGSADGQAQTTSYQVTGAEDARFELARRCHQHAFQVC
jgi:hypothetical protein